MSLFSTITADSTYALQGIETLRRQTDEEIRSSDYQKGREAGISLGKTVSDYARTKGISFEEARKVLGI